MAKLATKRFLKAPSHFFLKVSWVRVRPVSYLFTLDNRKKLVRARSGK
jgi:hypothetical protein